MRWRYYKATDTGVFYRLGSKAVEVYDGAAWLRFSYTIPANAKKFYKLKPILKVDAFLEMI